MKSKDFAPKEKLKFNLKVNDLIAHSGNMPWAVDLVEDKISRVLQLQDKPLESIQIDRLDCKLEVASELLEYIASAS